MSDTMLPCPTCATTNLIKAGWCRSCGNKLVFEQSLINAAIAEQARNDRSAHLRNQALAWTGLGLGALLVGLVVRIFFAPAIPGLWLPPLERTSTLGDASRWPAASAVSTGSGPASASTATTALLAAHPQSVLAWRSTFAEDLLAGCGIATDVLRVRTQRIVAEQRKDGSWGSAASTALMVVACQAAPFDALSRNAAARGRAWLLERRSQWRSWPASAQAQTLLALIEAGALSNEDIISYHALIINGSAPLWQTLVLGACPRDAYPPLLIALENACEIHGKMMLGFAARRVGRDPGTALQAVIEARPVGVAGELRVQWAMAAWASGSSTPEVITVLRGWANQGLPEHASVTSSHADAWAIIASTIPARYPGGWWATSP